MGDRGVKVEPVAMSQILLLEANNPPSVDINMDANTGLVSDESVFPTTEMFDEVRHSLLPLP